MHRRLEMKKPVQVQKRTRKISLADKVRKQIFSDYLRDEIIVPGSVLPSVKELSDAYEVSSITVRAAIQALRDQGRISIRNGVGAIVLPSTVLPENSGRLVYNIDRLTSIDMLIKKAGKQVETTEVGWGIESASPQASYALRVPVGDPVQVVRRVKLIDDMPVAWIVDTLGPDTIPADELKTEFFGSVLDILLSRAEHHLEFADWSGTFETPDESVLEMLQMSKKSQVLCIQTTAYSLEVIPVLWGQLWLNPKYFRLATRRMVPFVE